MEEQIAGHDDYDSPWKTVIEQYFPEFMAFYFPDAYAQIDGSKEHVFLDQELRAVVQDAELGKRVLDKLVRVALLNGDENWIYLHLEVQGTQQAGFAERMFVYNYRLYDRYRRPVASMAVLADAHEQWKPTSFGFTVLGCKHTLEFPVAKLMDYQHTIEELLVSDNAFALITVAHILTQQTRNKHQARYEAKLRLVRLLYQRHWDKQRVINLFVVLDWLMRLPEWLDQQIWHEIETIEETEKMQYITSVERIGIAKGRLEGQLEGRLEGRQEGRLEGRQEGRQEGRLEGESKLLRKLLERRFGPLPIWAINQLNDAAEQDLDAWGEGVLTASSLEAVFGRDASH